MKMSITVLDDQIFNSVVRKVMIVQTLTATSMVSLLRCTPFNAYVATN